MTRIARVFPRRTNATPTDKLAFIGGPDLLSLTEEIDRAQISVAFTWDWPAAERLAKEWERIAPVEIGGPATGAVAGNFEPGQFLKPGYTITSRGCPNDCWFCRAWRQHDGVQELPIRDGWIVQDDNLLACSVSHIQSVFAMLQEQPERAVFSGGLEAARLQDWHLDLLTFLRPRPSLFFAYDTPDDLEPLVIALRMVWHAGFTKASHRVGCYVLIGYPDDTIPAAVGRLQNVRDLGATPFAMLYHDNAGNVLSAKWRKLQRAWARPTIVHARSVS